MGDLGLYDSDLQVWGHSSCFLLNVAPHLFGGPVEPQKAQGTYVFSRCHLTDVVSISIFQWTIVVLTPGTGLDWTGQSRGASCFECHLWAGWLDCPCWPV
jgi:hypothetical protein